jgi:acyl-coenzyme A thioesterase PaaI-like protein
MNTKAKGEVVDATTRERVTSTLAALPYARHLGIRAAEVDGAGTVVLHLPFEARWIGNVTLPAYHGGVVATLMQVAALTATYVLLDEDTQAGGLFDRLPEFGRAWGLVRPL